MEMKRQRLSRSVKNLQGKNELFIIANLFFLYFRDIFVDTYVISFCAFLIFNT